MRMIGSLIVGYLISFSNAQDCCQRKVVSEPNEFAGVYFFLKKFDGPKNENCADACIYTKDGGDGDQFCFKAVDSGAATIEDQCDTISGASSFTSTRKISSLA